VIFQVLKTRALHQLRKNWCNTGWDGLVMSRGGLPSHQSVVGVLDRVGSVRRGRGRPKLTWDELVMRDLKEWDIPKELVMNRSTWRLAINVPKTWSFLFLLFFCVLCFVLLLPLFLVGFISSLPQLAWDKRLSSSSCCCFIHFSNVIHVKTCLGHLVY
jgi:hypothetical protein